MTYFVTTNLPGYLSDCPSHKMESIDDAIDSLLAEIAQTANSLEIDPLEPDSILLKEALSMDDVCSILYGGFCHEIQKID